MHGGKGCLSDARHGVCLMHMEQACVLVRIKKRTGKSCNVARVVGM